MLPSSSIAYPNGSQAENQSLEEPGSAYMNNAKYPVGKPPKTKQKNRKVSSFITYIYIKDQAQQTA